MQEGFLGWFYRDGIKRAAAVWFNFVRATYDTFSIKFLLKTLIYPWKRDVVAPVNPSLQTLVQAFGFNLVSRFIGAIVRLAAIFAGLAATALVFIIGGFITFAFCLMPFALLPTYRYLKTEVEPLMIETLDKLAQRPEIIFILRRADLDPSRVAAAAGQAFVDKAALKKTAEHFAQILGFDDHPRPSHLLLAYFELAPSLNAMLTDHDLIVEELAEIVAWQDRLAKHFAKTPIFAAPEKIRASSHIGYDWAAGYTPELNRFARQIAAPADLDEYLVHREAVDAIINVLNRVGKHNVVLVGDPGVGKATIVKALARAAGDARKIFALDCNLLLAGLNLADDFESRLVGVLNDALHGGDVILYVEDIERLLRQDQVNTASASAIVGPYLSSPNFALVGTTTFEHYHNLIETNSALVANLERIDVTEPKPQQVMRILEDLAPLFEKRSQVIITYQAIREIVRTSERFLTQRRFPEKAIDILDEIVAAAGPQRIIAQRDIDALVGAKTHAPVGSPLAKEKELLKNLEAILHKRLIDQNQAVTAIATALRRARAGVSPEGKPIGSFLFLGPTGVGKTETAKALAQAYFGAEQAMARFDMSEYQTSNSVERLLNALAEAISQKPFTVVLLDEIEKTYPDILNIFLQVLDEGRLTSPTGHKADFRNTIIIATSNAGSEFIREAANSKQQPTSQELLDYVQKQGIFRPEFLNRFTAVVAFNPLGAEQLVKVVDILLDRMNKLLEIQQVRVSLDEPAKQKLAQLGFDPQFGARQLERAMREKIENIVAARILNGQLQKGQTMLITEAMI